MMNANVPESLDPTARRSSDAPRQNGLAPSEPRAQPRVNIGISDESLLGVSLLLNRALANTSLLTIKTRKFHWDAVGPQFHSLHKLWDEQYAMLAEFADRTAERIRARGGYPIGTAAGFLKYATVREHPGVVLSAPESVAVLLEDHELIARTLRVEVDACDGFNDVTTADFLTGMLEAHERMAWMLRAFLEGTVAPTERVPTATATIPAFAE